jgi:RnfABCDGE-type electron transport complex B subunit
MEILIPILTLGFLGVIFGIGLAIASKKLAVNIDPRLERIHGLLPGSNCGACGGAGCFGFAEDLLSGKAKASACRVSQEEVKERIAGILGQKLEKTAKLVAVLHCNGGKKVKNKFVYDGIADCVAANLVLKGQKECVFGCLGFGTCVSACPFGAISMENSLPKVDPAKCKACNKCVQACPKRLFTLIPSEQSVVVSCRSLNMGKDVKYVCPVGCIACKICEKTCKFDAIHVLGNLAYIDYKKCTSCGGCVKVCPSKTINILAK